MYVNFDFYNGAMSTDQCMELRGVLEVGPTDRGTYYRAQTAGRVVLGLEEQTTRRVALGKPIHRLGAHCCAYKLMSYIVL